MSDVDMIHYSCPDCEMVVEGLSNPPMIQALSEHAWTHGRPLSLGQMVMWTQQALPFPESLAEMRYDEARRRHPSSAHLER